MNEDAVKFASLLTEDNKRLRTEALDLQHKVWALERELLTVVCLAGGRVERTAGVEQPERDPKFPDIRRPHLRRVYDMLNDRTSAWLVEEEVAPAEVDAA